MSDQELTIEDFHNLFKEKHPDIKDVYLRNPRFLKHNIYRSNAFNVMFNIKLVFKNGFKYDFTYSIYLLFCWDYMDVLENTYRNAWIKQYMFPHIKLLEEVTYNDSYI